MSSHATRLASSFFQLLGEKAITNQRRKPFMNLDGAEKMLPRRIIGCIEKCSFLGTIPGPVKKSLGVYQSTRSSWPSHKPRFFSSFLLRESVFAKELQILPQGNVMSVVLWPHFHGLCIGFFLFVCFYSRVITTSLIR